MTRLRKMMLEELQRRNYSAITTRNYLRVVTDFAKYFGKSPDRLGPNELRTYQAYLLRERKLTPGTVVNQVAALRFFFVKTLKRHQFRDFLPYPQDRRRLPTVLSREEVSHLINAAGNLFRRTLLMTLYGTGMRRAELAPLKVTDIDSQRMIIRVVAGKGGKDRDLPLSPALLETLREYWRWRKPKLYLSQQPLRLTIPREERLARVADALLDHVGDDRTLEAWAHVAGMSRRTFMRAFSAEVGMSFGRWRQQARLFAALEMLAQRKSVTEVAIAVGYDSVSAFIEMFRTMLGATPQTYFRGRRS